MDGLKKKTAKDGFPVFDLKTVHESDIIKAIKKAKPKRSTGIDGISMQVLKMSANIIAIPLARLFNISINKGEFPSRWKTAVVSPILKKGSPKSKENYRPVALLSSMSKVFESVIHAQLTKHIVRAKIFPSSQHGFRSK